MSGADVIFTSTASDFTNAITISTADDVSINTNVTTNKDVTITSSGSDAVFTVANGMTLDTTNNDLVLATSDINISGLINLGTAQLQLVANDSLSLGTASGSTMSLTTDELNAINAGTYDISSSSADITVSGLVFAQALQLTTTASGADIIFNGAVSTLGGLLLATSDAVILTTSLTLSGAVTVNAGGAVIMSDSGSIDAGNSSITITANGDITLGALSTTSNAISAISLTSNSGAVLDGGDSETDLSVSNGRLIINAANGVGTASNALDIDVDSLDVTNGTADIYIAETSSDGLTVIRLLQTGTGDISLISVGDISLDAQGSLSNVVSANDTGSITVISQADISILDHVVTDNGDVLIQANGDVITGTGGVTVGSTTGDLILLADFDQNSVGVLTLGVDTVLLGLVESSPVTDAESETVTTQVNEAQTSTDPTTIVPAEPTISTIEENSILSFQGDNNEEAVSQTAPASEELPGADEETGVLLTEEEEFSMSSEEESNNSITEEEELIVNSDEEDNNTFDAEEEEFLSSEEEDEFSASSNEDENGLGSAEEEAIIEADEEESAADVDEESSMNNEEDEMTGTTDEDESSTQSEDEANDSDDSPSTDQVCRAAPDALRPS